MTDWSLKHEKYCPLYGESDRKKIEPYLAVFRTYDYDPETGNFKAVDAFVKCMICDTVLKEKKFEEG